MRSTKLGDFGIPSGHLEPFVHAVTARSATQHPQVPPNTGTATQNGREVDSQSDSIVFRESESIPLKTSTGDLKEYSIDGSWLSTFKAMPSQERLAIAFAMTAGAGLATSIGAATVFLPDFDDKVTCQHLDFVSQTRVRMEL